MSIRPLPPDVVAQIKSSTVITSVNGVIYELMKNSLDAGAKKIDVTVDYSRGGCTVEDDGLGILPLDFASGGGLGKPHREFHLLYLLYASHIANRRQIHPNLSRSPFATGVMAHFSVLYQHCLCLQ